MDNSLLHRKSICFVGAGNMASSIIGGLITQGMPPKSLLACDPSEANRQNLNTQFDISVSDNNHDGAQADVIVLAVKPQVMASVCKDLAPVLHQNSLVISIAAGITCESLAGWLGSQIIVRCMPNTPALVQLGASALYASTAVDDEQQTLADAILSSVGIVEWVDDENLIDTVTAVSGSGPAYFFLFIEAMIDSAVRQGMAVDTARNLAIQTALGSAKLAQDSDNEIAELRRRVTSPGGTTERAIKSFEEDSLRSIVDKAMQACADRSRELAKHTDV